MVLDTLTAIGTVGAVWAALWGDRLRQRLFAPAACSINVSARCVPGSGAQSR